MASKIAPRARGNARRSSWLVVISALAWLTVLATSGAAKTAAADPAARTSNALCGALDTAPAPTAVTHVVWIWLENHSYGQIIGSPGSAAYANSPYINGTVVPQCGLAVNYHNVSHPSLPNYLGSVAGIGGMMTGCSPSGCPQSTDSIFAQLDRAGRAWGGYAESMTSNCSRTDTALYAARHNPALYYPAVRTSCATSDVPIGTTSSGAFQTALRNDALPPFSFVTPNLCNDSHNCSARSSDTWLATWLPAITNSPGYQSGNIVVFITWDEGDHGATNVCATNTTDQGCHVATLVLSPFTHPATKALTLYNHYSLLRTTENLLGLPLLAHAADPTSNDMRTDFHL